MLTKAGGDDRGTDPRLVKLQDALATPDGVQLVSPPSINKAGDAASFTVIPTTRPADPKTADLVTQMRTSVIPPATGGGVTAYVGGSPPPTSTWPARSPPSCCSGSSSGPP
jgi:RND superfamily putative drug exporter